MPFCTQCGSRNPDSARFCAQCGTRIVAATPAAEQGSVAASEETSTNLDVSSTATFTAPAVKAEGEQERASLADDDAAAVDALPTGSALLIVQRGPGAGNRFLLDQETVNAGRHPESEIFLDDITVSRRHVEFRRSGDGYTVHDVGSLNGTYVNRDRIDQSSLQNGDEVQIGKFRLVYFVGDAAQGR